MIIGTKDNIINKLVVQKKNTYLSTADELSDRSLDSLLARLIPLDHISLNQRSEIQPSDNLITNRLECLSITTSIPFVGDLTEVLITKILLEILIP